MKIKVQKKGNYSQLRLLFPQLQIAQDYPIYSRYIFSTFDYDVGSKNELFLLQDPAGIPLDTQSGLCLFLTQVKYMQQSKIERLRKVQSFGDKELVYAMYHEAISLKIANRSYLEADELFVPVQDLLKLPFAAKVQACLLMGPDKVLPRLLSTLDKYFSHDVTMKSQQYSSLAESLVGFNTAKFKKEYKLTGDAEVDCLTLLTYLPYRR